jgi:amidase
MSFVLEEATIALIQTAFESGELTSRQLVIMYMERISALDKAGPKLNAVLELNPDALFIAEALDEERVKQGPRGPLHGVPILIKDNINTHDRMHTSAGSLALANSYAPADAYLVAKLREAGAVVLGKANLTEFANFMTEGMPSGYSSRGGQVRNPYNAEVTPSGSSSGSAVAVAANLCAAAIGTETCGSIISPSYMNGIVGIKPTVGLVSRSGIVPISHTQDTAGPMCRTVEDAAVLLGALAGVDGQDPATWRSRYKAETDYTQFLDKDGLKGARIGINRGYFKDFDEEEAAIMNNAVEALTRAGAEVIEDIDIPHVTEEHSVLTLEFKAAINAYLSALGPNAPVHTLGDIIEFNVKHPKETLKYGQKILLKAEYGTSGTLTEPEYFHNRMSNYRKSQAEGIDGNMKEHRLDAIFCPGVTDLPAVAGYPVIMVPAGFTSNGVPAGVSFVGGAYSEPQLIKLAYAFEQQTKARVAPKF